MTAIVYQIYGESFTVGIDFIPAYITEMKSRKGISDVEYCDTVEYDDRGRPVALVNGLGEVVAEIEY